MLISALVYALVVLFTAWLVRRLLGFRRGRWVRTAAAVVVGLALTEAFLNSTSTALLELDNPGLELVLLAASVVLTSMVVAVLIEVLVPASNRRRRLPRPIRAVRRLWGRSLRYLQVAKIGLSNGLLARGDSVEPGGSRLGAALARTCEQAGGIFVKLAQAMAAQPQLVSVPVAHELERLQESAAPADRSAAVAVVEADLGPIEETFAEFDAQALGSASLGQTYLATLPDQRRVVVKVQRPGIDEAVYRDLDILGRFARTAEQRTDWASGMGLSGIVRDFSERTREELDYRLEAANMAAAALALEDEALIAVPAAVDGLCSRRVLVQEKAEGASVGRAGALDALTPEQRQGLADALLGAMVRSMVAGEVFHADPHPGNIFVADDGRLILIDWGAVGRLDPYERSGVSDLLRALQSRDAGLMRQAALSLGTSADPIDEDALERQLARLMGRAIGPDGRLDPVLFRDALTVFREVGLQLPQSTATLMRTLATLMGTLDVISPGYALAEAAGRIGGELAIQQFTGGGLKEVMTQEALRSAQVLRRLPSAVDSIARTAARGELRLRTSLFSDQRDVAAITRLVDRAVLGMIAAALAVASAVLLSSNAGPQVTADFSVVELFGAMGMVFALVLALRVVASALPSQANDG